MFEDIYYLVALVFLLVASVAAFVLIRRRKKEKEEERKAREEKERHRIESEALSSIEIERRHRLEETLHKKLKSMAEQESRREERHLGKAQIEHTENLWRKLEELKDLERLEELNELKELHRHRKKFNLGASPEEREYPVRFHALWHRVIKPETWQTLLVYIFCGSRGLDGARHDFQRRMTAPSSLYDDSSSMGRETIQRGTEILIYPELPGFRFNPPYSRVLWLEDWHCIEFRMQAQDNIVATNGRHIEGRVAFYVGLLLIGETALHAVISEQERLPIEESGFDESNWEENGATPYRAIFVSYSHEDNAIVDQLEHAYRALGDDYLRDISILRSGEEWSPALLSKIREAEIFQLCWSRAAKNSTYVEQEWRYALTLSRQRFVRPMYWQTPMPDPPKDLCEIHFSYVPFNDDTGI